MAQRAGESHTAVTCRHHANDGFRIDECERICRIVQVDGAGLNTGKDRLRNHVDVDLQPDRKRGRRPHAISDAAIRRACKCLMQPQRVTPEALIAEGVEAKDLQTLTEELAAGVLDDLIERARTRECGGWLRPDTAGEG